MSAPAPTTPSRGRDGWRVFGIVVAVVVAVLGLAALAAVVLFVVAMNSFGSNK